MTSVPLKSSCVIKNTTTCILSSFMQTDTQTNASSSHFSRHSDVNVTFISRPQRLTRFHDVAAWLSLICFCCPVHTIMVRVVLARGCEHGCVMWYRTEWEHLFYKSFSSFHSSGQMERHWDHWWGQLLQLRMTKRISWRRRRVTACWKPWFEKCVCALQLDWQWAKTLQMADVQLPDKTCIVFSNCLLHSQWKRYAKHFWWEVFHLVATCYFSFSKNSYQNLCWQRVCLYRFLSHNLWLVLLRIRCPAI